MYKYLCCFVLCLSFFVTPLRANAQADPVGPAAKSAAQPDYSKEAFVAEEDVTKISFENDGTGTREWLLRIRIQSDAGVQRYSVLTFPYAAATDSVDIDYVRVRKPDGTVIVTPADSFQDMPSEVTRQAPFYSDQHEKHVAVKGLAADDVLEAHAQWQVKKPLAPGQFWSAFNFTHDFIVLHQEFQVSVPKDRAVKWKSPTVKPVIAEEGTRRIFTWTSSQLEAVSTEAEKKDQDNKLYQTARGKLPPPDVQISSFQSWDEVGGWYNGLQQERVKPSADVRAKAAEVTKDAKDDNAKLHAIYNYVSTQYHYIGVAFGIGRYQPHSADDVLANQYGDCKDKHTLLASLLDAAGIKASPALIGSLHELDPDVPSPAQFDHVITAVPQGSEYLWLDSTEEVAPFGYLLSILRDKPALVIPEGKPAALVTTTAAPPSPALQTFKIDAKLDDTGTLQGKIERSISGDDAEILFRAAFRRTPLTQWKDLVQQISYGSGFAGDVSDVTASTPERTDEPFHWSYNYKRKDFPQWSERRIGSPLPPMLSAAPDDKPNHPILLGAVGEIRSESRVELPKGYLPELPARVDLKEDFAEYHGIYSASNGVLLTERKLVIKMREVAVAEYEAYKKFAKAISDDGNVYAALSTAASPNDPQAAIRGLPASDNDEAMRAYNAAADHWRSGDTQGAIDSFNRAVTSDPKFARAWMMLASLYAAMRRRDEAVDTLRRANEAVPGQPVIYKALVSSLMEMHRYDEAISILQVDVKNDPSNVDLLLGLGEALTSAKRYDEAASIFDSAVKTAPDDSRLQAHLAFAYLQAGKEENAVTAFQKALVMDPRPLRFNDIGYELADANKQLPLALEYAQKAVHEEEEASAKVKLSELKSDDLEHTRALAAFWDTLGWVHFRMGNLDRAARYLNASWSLAQDSTVADHLGQVYEQQHKKEAAIHMYRLALYRSTQGGPRTRLPDGGEETRTRLQRLASGKVLDPRDMPALSDELNKMRTLKLPRIIPGEASAEFFLAFGPGAKLEDVKFVSGSEALKSSSKALRAAPFNPPLPDDGPTLLVRRGMLVCYKYGGCAFVFFDPNDVHSVD